MKGLGLLLWIVQEAFNGDVAKIIAAAKEAGARRIGVKHYDYTINRTGFYNLHNQAAYLKPLSDACRAAGIEFWVWYYPYAYAAPEFEAEQAARLAKELNAFGIYVDAEEPWRWKYADARYNPDIKDRAAKQAYARAHMAALRRNFTGPIAFTSYRNPVSINNFPWKECIEGSDYVAPQCYFERTRPRPDFLRSVAQHAQIGYPFKAPKFIPMWPAYQERGWEPSPQEILECYQLTLEHGLEGCDFWRFEWALRKPAHWRAIVEGNPWREKPEPPVAPAPRPRTRPTKRPGGHPKPF